jgi:hypothetical protein
MGEVGLARSALLAGVVAGCELPGFLDACEIFFRAMFANSREQALKSRIGSYRGWGRGRDRIRRRFGRGN